MRTSRTFFDRRGAEDEGNAEPRATENRFQRLGAPAVKVFRMQSYTRCFSCGDNSGESSLRSRKYARIWSRSRGLFPVN